MSFGNGTAPPGSAKTKITMRIPFNDILVQFSSPDAAIEAQWARLFAGWPSAKEDAVIDITLHLELADALPALPANPHFSATPNAIPERPLFWRCTRRKGKASFCIFWMGPG
ncbi:MAG: hypothetical protein M5U34_02605 [Chloroflexi bacterium]|nr:hypothetical protein [Chloroflexota bacterium]